MSQRPAGSDPIQCALTQGRLRFCSRVDALSSSPLIGVNGRYWELDFRPTPEATPVLGWVGAAASDHSTFIGVLDSQVELPSAQLVLVMSIDAGQTWTRLPDLEKPHSLAVFRTLAVKSAAHWNLTLSLDSCADCGAARGTYTYETLDAGQHWNAAKVTPAGRLKKRI